MPYAIANIIYGVPLSTKAARAITGCELFTEDGKLIANGKTFKVIGDGDNCQTYGFEALYNQGNGHIGFCGVQLSRFDECEAERPVDWYIKKLAKQPTKAQKAKAERLLAKAHPKILKLCPKPGVYLIWSSS